MHESGPRSACLLATASLTLDSDASSLRDALDASRPEVAAIAAWRLGRSAREGLDDESWVALFRAAYGPAGRRREAANAALAGLVGTQQGARGPADFELPEAPPTRDQWSATLTRWVDAQVLNAYQPVDADALQALRPHITRALLGLSEGSPAERMMAERALRDCDPDPSGGNRICLAPLGRGSIAVE